MKVNTGSKLKMIGFSLRLGLEFRVRFRGLDQAVRVKVINYAFNSLHKAPPH